MAVDDMEPLLLGEGDGRVLLSPEPEAAAHCARVSGAGQGNAGPAPMAPGARFMVVDCGGGTADITGYQNDNRTA
ncbi:hypothetical protein ACWFRQ_01465 [Streptomyces niveus]